MDNFWSSLRQAFGHLGTIRVMDIVDILLVAAFFYFLITLVRRTKTNKLFQGIVYILLALWLSGELACVDMSATRTGALIIFERDNRLDDQIRTGTILDAETTAELLKNIFYPKAPLHDGAAIIRSGRIQAAGCMLPLSNNPNLSKELGMRHRAGIGMSEASDAVVVIVSEETGAISVAVNGMLKRHLTKDTFEKILRNELIPEVKEEPTGAFRFLRRKEKDKADE